MSKRNQVPPEDIDPDTEIPADAEMSGSLRGKEALKALFLAMAQDSDDPDSIEHRSPPGAAADDTLVPPGN